MHFLLSLVKDTFARVDDPGVDDNPKAVAFRVLVVVVGIMLSSIATTYLSAWLHRLWSYSTPLFVVVWLVLAALGPDAMPPMTLCQGSESPTVRLVTTAVFLLTVLVVNDGRVTDGLFALLWLISGVWHLTESDANYKAYVSGYVAAGYGGVNEELAKNIRHEIGLQCFRGGAAVGMIVAICGCCGGAVLQS